jgi:hypothetical protein
MEPEASLPHLHVPTTCPYHEPDQTSPCPTTHFMKIHLNIILPPMPGSSKWYLVWTKSTKLNPNIRTLSRDTSCQKRNRNPEADVLSCEFIWYFYFNISRRQNHKLRRAVSHETYIFSIHFWRRNNRKQNITWSIQILIPPYTRVSVWMLPSVRDAQII